VIALHRVADVSLPVDPGPLDWEVENKGAIDAHWARAVARNPALFDGRVHMATDVSVQGGRLTALCVPVRFASFLRWRDTGYPGPAMRLAFGFAATTASDGALLLGRMADHTANPNRVYFPGGVIDESDCSDGCLDAEGNIRRELAEECGLDTDQISLRPGFLVVETPVELAVGRVADMPWPATEARDRLLESIEARGDGELVDIIAVGCGADTEGLDLAPYARAVIDWTFPP